MRRIVMFNNVSADGYFSAPDGNLNWVVQDEAVFRESTQGRTEAGTMLFGRRTYDMFERFWPHALDDPATAPDPHVPGRRSETTRQMAVIINESEKIVFSKGRKDVTWKNSRLVRALDPREIAKMKDQPGGGMIIFGSGTIVAQLTEHRLIDEYQMVVSPVVLGGGKRLFEGVREAAKLKLLDSKAFPSGVVMLRYAPAS